ncbi:carboxypeptidase-like regulatory domain-containing protein [Mucilaginibacter antarcticus]|uniref:carboxypeptidase-like regulatory domain-containing protein n=1 Tax=Mucilaginibacter antarcticus TaxID=1855725 RepID=UPI00364406D2
MAACLLLMLGGGYWFLNRQPNKIQYATNVGVDSASITRNTPSPVKDSNTNIANSLILEQEQRIPAKPKADKVQYLAKHNAVKETRTVDNPLNDMESIGIDSNGAIKQQGLTVTKARINGKNYSGGGVKDAIKNLPPEVIDRIQTIDDYAYNTKPKSSLGVYGSKAPVVGLKPTYKKGAFGSIANPPLLGPSQLPPGKVVITGTILDAANKEPLTGATIAINGKGLTQADINGKYTVTVDTNATLSYQFVSYKELSVKLKPGQTIANANLATDTKAMNEVVIRGYVKRDRDQTTGSSYIITGKEVQDNPVGNVDQLLQGKVAGLNIQNNTGAPGMRGSVNIRGLATPYAVTDPTKQPYFVNARVFNDALKPVNAINLSLGGKYITKADGKGVYQLLCIGPVVLSVSVPGYVTQHIMIHNADTATIVLKKSKVYDCNENPEFKTQFDQNIDIAEKFTSGYLKKVTDAEFIEAIKFIDRRTKVSIGTRKSARYKDLDAFMVDKAKWLNWYEAKNVKD